jgi:drug/metabolite transporter (DMT)-like permease
MRTIGAAFLAAVTASLYALATSLQALEARNAPKSEALSASLIARLVRRPLWLLGTVCGLLAWPLQAVALSFGSVTLVQPALGFGLVVLLILGVTVLHESVGPREVAGVLAIAGGVAILGWAGPSETGSFTTAGTWITGVALALVAPAPYVLRRLGRAGGLPTSIAAGLGWACLGLGTALLDVAIADRHLLVALAWAVACGAVAWGSLLAEMTSLQTWAATRAIPVAFGLEMAVPAALAPFLTQRQPPHAVAFAAGLALACAGAIALGTSRAVARAAVPLTEP